MILRRLRLPQNRMAYTKLLLQTCDTLLELVHASASVYELLLAGEKGMAFGADFNGHIALRRTGLIFGTARTFDRAFLVIGMDSGFHRQSFLSDHSKTVGKSEKIKSFP